jgi:16S rRNA (cytidine1402-2'-O)-methyltransferase
VGRLYVVGTPIGNLEDITYRAVRVLSDVPVILAEDTRHTRKLLTHYGITTRMLSYHQHNKRARLDLALATLSDGDVALVSSAGMPSVSDPGFELIQAARRSGFEIDVLPGASAVITAVVGAAIPAPGFLFAGFLPRSRSDRRAKLEELRAVPASLVLFESPHRLRAMLDDCLLVLGDRQAAAGRELTKIHQEYIRSTVAELVARYRESEPRGEYTLVIGPDEQVEEIDASDAARAVITASRRDGEDRKSVLRMVEERFHMSRNAAYALWLEVAAGDDGGRHS